MTGAPDVYAARAAIDDLASSYERAQRLGRHSLALRPCRVHPGRRPDGLTWCLATAILRRAPWPFRYFDPDRASGVEATIRSAEQILRR